MENVIRNTIGILIGFVTTGLCGSVLETLAEDCDIVGKIVTGDIVFE